MNSSIKATRVLIDIKILNLQPIYLEKIKMLDKVKELIGDVNTFNATSKEEVEAFQNTVFRE